MEEKVILSSKSWPSYKEILIRIGIALAVISVVSLLSTLGNVIEISSYYDSEIERITSKGGYAYIYEPVLNQIRDAKADEIGALFSSVFTYIFILVLAATAVSSLVYFLFFTNELTITNCRVSGKIFGGKRVDLPLDSISAVSILPLLKNVAVSSSSGHISFLFMRNSDELYATINGLILERHANAPAPTPQVVPAPQHTPATAITADTLKQYKELLDMGIITQEEFDAKKKQFLEQ